MSPRASLAPSHLVDFASRSVIGSSTPDGVNSRRCGTNIEPRTTTARVVNISPRATTLRCRDALLLRDRRLCCRDSDVLRPRYDWSPMKTVAMIHANIASVWRPRLRRRHGWRRFTVQENRYPWLERRSFSTILIFGTGSPSIPVIPSPGCCAVAFSDQ